MATIYTHIAANKRRSFILIAIFTLIIAGIGYLFAEYFSYGYGVLVLAILLAVIMNLVGYFSGDAIALRAAGAKGPIKKDDNPYVYRMVENLAITGGLPMPKIYIIEDSAMNAFATGRSPEKSSIALTTGLIEGLENEELEGVIAHELSHIGNYDIRFMMLVVVLVGVIALLSHFFVRMSIFGGGRRRSSGGGGRLGLIFAILGLIFIIFSPIIAELIKLSISRKREYLADATGSLLTRYPEGLANALVKIELQNKRMKTASEATAHLFISNPFGARSRGMSKLFSTHPPINDRIHRLQEMGGTRNSATA